MAAYLSEVGWRRRLSNWERLDEMIEYCRSNANETNIVNEMRRVMETTSDSGINETAHALLRFLEEKYDTKKWLVIVISSDSGIANPSGGFHVASSNGTHALAITNGAHTSDDGFLLSPRQRQYLEEFTCPLIVSEKRRTPTRNYLYRYLTPLRTSNRFDVETLIARNGYMVFHNDSEFVEWENASCGSDYTVLVVPTARPRPIAPDIEFEPSCFPQNQSDGFMMLRNDFLQGYRRLRAIRRQTALASLSIASGKITRGRDGASSIIS